ncbi:hypothetical protein A3N60_08820 [Klebsiella aerogenes]|nr:hypothetical protein A3N60_08820 [Klebsiella aerogenes]OAZ22149.1 hypothetical protein A1J85_22445 [Klebsiella aerogenes]
MGVALAVQLQVVISTFPEGRGLMGKPESIYTLGMAAHHQWVAVGAQVIKGVMLAMLMALEAVVHTILPKVVRGIPVVQVNKASSS